jgi:hypothetical protein
MQVTKNKIDFMVENIVFNFRFYSGVFYFIIFYF